MVELNNDDLKSIKRKRAEALLALKILSKYKITINGNKLDLFFYQKDKNTYSLHYEIYGIKKRVEINPISISEKGEMLKVKTSSDLSLISNIDENKISPDIYNILSKNNLIDNRGYITKIGQTTSLYELNDSRTLKFAKDIFHSVRDEKLRNERIDQLRREKFHRDFEKLEEKRKQSIPGRYSLDTRWEMLSKKKTFDEVKYHSDIGMKAFHKLQNEVQNIQNPDDLPNGIKEMAEFLESYKETLDEYFHIEKEYIDYLKANLDTNEKKMLIALNLGANGVKNLTERYNMNVSKNSQTTKIEMDILTEDTFKEIMELTQNNALEAHSLFKSLAEGDYKTPVNNFLQQIGLVESHEIIKKEINEIQWEEAKSQHAIKLTPIGQKLAKIFLQEISLEQKKDISLTL